MLRRVLPFLRWGLLSLGVAQLLWLPLSYVWLIRLSSSSPIRIVDGGQVVVVRGLIHVDIYEQWPVDVQATFRAISVAELDAMPPPQGAVQQTRRPDAFEWIRISSGPVVHLMVAFPLWLLAAVCLAWPVTSLLVRRRRRGRGFEVEAKGGGAAPDATGGRGAGDRGMTMEFRLQERLEKLQGLLTAEGLADHARSLADAAESSHGWSERLGRTAQLLEVLIASPQPKSSHVRAVATDILDFIREFQDRWEVVAQGGTKDEFWRWRKSWTPKRREE